MEHARLASGSEAPGERGEHPPRILLVEDDPTIREMTRLALERDGFVVATAHDSDSGLAAYRAQPPDLVLLDVMLPGVGGVGVCRTIREQSVVPIVMLTARSDPVDVVLGLEAGADDYVTKPFDPAVLAARLRAVLRRGTPRENTLRVADLEVDTVRRTVRRAGRAVELKPKEYALLEYLVRNSDRPLTKSLIIEHVWNIHFDSVSNVVEVHINALRNKIDRGFDRPLIHTLRGVGYILTDRPAET